MFFINKVFEPYEQADDQDLWIVEIDQVHDETRLRSEDNIDHTGCIEIRAFSEEVALKRAQAIVNALNDDNVSCVEPNVSTAFERARVVV